MNWKHEFFKITRIVCIFFSYFIFFSTTASLAASLKLSWNPNTPAPEGYRVFVRRGNQAYNYNQPDWQGAHATCTFNNLEDQTEYYFVVRAFDGSITGPSSDEVHYVPLVANNNPAPVPTNGVLDSRFVETTLTGGIEYYTDRSYQLTGVPSSYDNMDAIITPNDDRNRTDASGYLTFAMPYTGTVYVAYDSRATSLPNWMNGFIDTGDVLKTSLSSQPSFKIYGRSYAKGAIVNFGGNKAAGFAGGTVSNYLVFYSNTTAAPSGNGLADLGSRFLESTLTTGFEYYTDRSYQLTGVPSSYDNMDAIITPNDDRNRTDASGYLTFAMPYTGTVYVAYDSRATSLPNWMNGFIDTGDVLKTSLSSQPSLKIYGRSYANGAIVNFGGNKAAGFAGGTVSNYLVFYSN